MKKLLSLLIILALLPLTAHAANEENRDICYRYITEVMGYHRAAACGILANIQYESNFRPTATGDGGNAYGICQWNSRRESLKKHAYNYCLEHGEIADLDESWKNLYAQLSYLNYELENNKKSVGKYLKELPDTAQGAYDAASYFCIYFEIPADRYNKAVTRGKAAVNTYYKLYGGEVSTCTVTYDTMGGSGLPAPQVKTEGVPLNISDLEPILSGYVFAGWSTDPFGLTAEYQPGDLFTGNTDTILFALWTPLTTDELLYSVDEGGCTVTGYTGSAQQVIIPAEFGGLPVTAIDYGAFLGHDTPFGVCIPDSVTYIEEDAFPDGTTLICSVGSAAHAYAIEHGLGFSLTASAGIKLGKNVFSVEAGAFDGTVLTGLDLSATRITVIPEGAFSGCALLRVITLSSRVTSIADGAIPEGVLIVCPASSYAHDYAVSRGYPTADGGTTGN